MKSIMTLLMLVVLSQLALAQNPTYELILKNDVIVSSTVYEFDIVLQRTGGTPFELASIQPILTFDPLITAGTISVSMNAGSSDLNSSQQPTTMSVVGSEIRINPRVPPGAGSGTIIPASPGLRVGRFRLTASISFEDQPANLAWKNSSDPFTKVFAYVGGLNTEIEDSTGHLNQLANASLLSATQVAFIQQPTNTVAGASISPAITVQLRNSLNGGVSTAGVNISLALTTGTGPLNGTLTAVTNGSGIATFTGLSINLPGSKDLTASSAGLSSAVSNAFTISAGPASAIAFTQQPTDAVAGVNISPSITVNVQDALGNNVLASGVTVNMSLTSGTGTLSGTVSRSTNASGVATFNDLNVDLAGAKILTASATGGGLGTKASTSFNITHAAASKVAFIQGPTAVSAGATIAPPVTVQLEDTFGNSVPTSGTSVSLTLSTGTGVLSGGGAQTTDGTGLATFSGLSINLIGSKNLTASSAGLTSNVSNTFTVSAGTATKVVFLQQPTNRTAGLTLAPAVTVQVEDALGNAIATSGIPVTVALTTGTGTLGGTLTQNTGAGGLATFNDLSVDLAGSKNLTASSSGLTSAISNAFTISAATVSKIVFVQQPSDAAAGAVIAPAVTLQLQDALGNNISTSGTSVSVALTSGTGVLSGTVTQTTNASGLATFSTLSINLAGSKNITATSAGLTSAISNAFAISAGSASKVVFIQQPTNATAGVVLSPSITVQLEDALGNTIASIGVPVALSLSTGSGTLGGTLTQNTDAGGLATFNDISVNLTGSKNLTAASAGVTSAISSAFTIGAAGAADLAFVQQPTNTTAGATIAPAVSVQLRDQFGNNVSTSGISVTMSLSTGTGTLSGTTSVPTNASGLATFSTLSINLAGSKNLTAASSGLTSAVSSPFTINTAAATQVAIVQQPTSTTAGSVITPAVTVQLRDAFANSISSPGIGVTLTITSGTGVLSGTATQLTNASGLATFNDLSVNLAGAKNLTASSTGLTSAISSAFTILAASASQLVFLQQPTSALPGVALAPAVTVQIQDNFGNNISASGVSITTALSSGTGTLSGTTTRITSAAGLATFNDLSINLVGTKGLTASSGGLASAVSSSFTIAAGTATTVRVETAPDGSGSVVPVQSLVSGSAITVYAITRDGSGNFVSNVAADSWSLASPTGGVAAGDLVPNGDVKSAILTGHLTGTAQIHVVSAALTPVNSGTITVSAGAATQLAFVQQPSNGLAGAFIAPAVSVQLRDVAGNNVSTAGISVTMSLSTGTGALTGTTTQLTNASGLATFSNLSVNQAGVKNITASASGLTAAVSSAFTLTTYTITASSGANGTISPTGAVNVISGGSQTFTMIPNAGFAVSSVLVDGISQGAVVSYPFDSVTTNHTISVTFVPATLTINVQTVPSGKTITVDGVNFTSPQTFTWTATQTHSIATDSLQTAAGSIRYAWNSWNDAGARSHNVTPLVNTTYTATFKTQFLLTVNANIGGTTTPATGYQDSAAFVQITAIPSSGYSFNFWGGSGPGAVIGGNNPGSVFMGGPISETANFTLNNVLISVTTSPPGQVFYVDSSPFTIQQTFSFLPGSVHSISTDSIQSQLGTSRYIWNNWSDGDTRTHSFLVPFSNTTYTAVFRRQFFLTMNAGTGGTVLPVSSWRDTAASVPISATPTVGYSFAGWTGSGTGSYTGPVNASSVTVNGAITENASFTLFPINVTVKSSPAGRTFIVDGTTYTNSQAFVWSATASHTINTVSPQGDTLTRYNWTSWSDAGAQSHAVAPVSDTTFTVNFSTQYYLTMAAGTGGTSSPASNWFNSGQSVPISATPGTGYSFANWTGSGTGSYTGGLASPSVTMNGPITETANFSPNNITVTFTTVPVGRSITVDGTTYTSPQTFTWVANVSHTIASDSLQNGVAGTRYDWTGWNDAGALSHSVSSLVNTTFTASFATQYFLTMNAGTGGTATPTSGWFNSAQVVPITGIPGTGYSFLNWIGSGTVSFSGASNPGSVTMNSPITETANFSPNTISVTVTTSPAARTIIVDGITYTAPQTFSWVANSNHTIQSDTLQNGSAGTRYVWSNWSDAGARLHTVAPLVNTTFTANFTTQYFLTMNTNVGGTVLPASGWHDSGESVVISATPTNNFGFLNWSGIGVGSYSGGNNPGTLFMLSPITETANFAQNPYQITVGTNPAGRAYRVNGSDYTLPQTFGVAPGNGLTLAIVTDPQSGPVGTRYAWASWSDSGAITHFFTPTSDSILVASFNTQYLLTMGAGTGGSVSPATNWFNSGSSVPITATPNVSYSFSTWSGTGSGSYTGPANPSSVTMNGPLSETGSFTLFPVQMTVHSDPPGRSVTVDGTIYTSPQTFTFTSGTSHTISSDSVQNGAAGTRYIYASWSDSGARSHSVTVVKDTTFTVKLKTQFFLTMNAGTGGTVSPASNWLDSAQTVSVSATPSGGYSFTSWAGSGAGSYSGSFNPAGVTMTGPVTESASFTLGNVLVTVTTSPAARTIIVDGTTYTAPQTFSWLANSNHTIQTDTIQNGAAGTRYAWSNWSDSGAAAHIVATSVPKTYSANFTIQYFLTMNTNVGGTVLPASGWHNSGESVLITATPASSYGFLNWNGGGVGSYSGGNNPGTLFMNSPITETANFAQNPYQITVGTNPANRAYRVNGSDYTLPQTFSVAPGNGLTLAIVTDPQSGAVGTRYTWASWSDSGAITHFFTPTSDSILVASFKTQYLLTTGAGTGGSVSPATNWFNSGSNVPITATPNLGYSFSTWAGSGSGSYTGPANPSSVTMNGPLSETGSFTLFPVQMTVQSDPPGRSVTVDGTIYTSPQTFTFTSGTSHTISSDSVQNGAASTRYIYSSWSDSGARTHSVTLVKDTTFTVKLKSQFFLTMNAGTGGTASPASSWIDSAQTVPVSATPSGGYSFTSWVGSGAGSYSGLLNPANVTMTGPITESASFTLGNVQVTVTTSPPARTIIVDGTAYTAPQTFSWLANSNHTIQADTIQNGGAGTRYVWSSWSDSGAATHVVAPSVPKIYTANFTTQYFLTMNSSLGGSIQPASGWHNSGEAVVITATPANGYGFLSWSGSGSGSYSGGNNPGTLFMVSPITEAVNFGQNAVLITVKTNPAGRTFLVDGALFTSTFTFSFLPGSVHTISADSIQVVAGGTRYLWTDWSDSAGRTHIIEVGTHDSTFTAHFKTQFGLTTNANPPFGGSISPSGQTFYNVGDTATLSATANSGFAFTAWTGSVVTNLNPTKVIMNTPKSVTGNFSPGARITLQTSPTGRSIVVDDSTYTAPMSFDWLLNSAHTVGTTSPQQLVAPTQYLWNTWSDSGAISHTITVVKDSVISASFTTQHYLFTVAGSGGTVSPDGAWYNAGDTVHINAAPNGGFGFIEWQGSGTGSYTGANSAASVIMQNWIVEVASFGTLLPPPSLSGIPDGASGIAPSPVLSWHAYPGATAYILQVATDSLFTNAVYDSASIADSTMRVPALQNKTMYFWRVKAKVGGNITTFSSARNFTTRPKSVSGVLPAKPWVTRFVQTLQWTSIDITGSVNVRLSTNSGTTYATLLTGIPNSGSYSWRLPDATPFGNSCKIRIESASDTSVHGETGTFAIYSGALPLIVPMSTVVSFPTDPQLSTLYRLVSNPGIVDSTKRLTDNLPGTPPADWRMFWDNGSAENYLEELTPLSRLITGHGYWLLKKKDFSFVTNMTMPVLDTVEASYPITLHDGWNIIANPFDKNVDWAAVLDLNGLPAATALYAYGGSFVTATTLEPFGGYYFFNGSGLGLLKMPYPFGPAPPHAMAQANGWRVQLSLRSDINEDPDNFIGVSSSARPGLDENDSHKPPLFLDQGFLYFNRPEWDKRFPRFSSDVRPGIGEGQTWQFEVSKTAGTKGSITFRGIDQIPAGLEVVLVNAYNTTPYDLRAHPTYTFTSIGPKMPFTMIVGTKDFVRGEIAKQLPTTFELSQNFPNPFNPTTSISVSLPHESRIRLDVYSILGQRVATLADGAYDQGIHTFVWEGVDDNHLPVATGVYLYRLLDGDNLVQTKKMILTK